MVNFTTRIQVNAPAEKSWEVVGTHFADIGEWAAQIDSSELKGTLPTKQQQQQQEGTEECTRICHVRGFGPIKETDVYERLDIYDVDNYTLAYTATEGLPAAIRTAKNHFVVRDLGEGKSEIISTASLEFRGIYKLFAPLAWIQFKTTGSKTFEELAYRIENNKPHPRKCAAVSGSRRAQMGC